MILFNPVVDTTEKGYGMAKVGESRKTKISPCDNVVIGAGSVVTKSIDKPGIYAGNPAKLIRII